MKRLLTAVLVCASACADQAPEDDPVTSLDELKQDSFRAPTEMGEIEEDGDWSRGELVANSRYQLWTFSILQRQPDVQLWTRSASDHHPDTVMYLYKRQADDSWGSYIDRNDDGHWQFADESGSYDEDLTPFSYLNLALDAGDYGVLIKGKYRTTKGAYYVTYDCNSGRNCR